MNESPQQREVRRERLLRQMRLLLEFARRAYPIDRETARAFEARAANKLALAIHEPPA